MSIQGAPPGTMSIAGFVAVVLSVSAASRPVQCALERWLADPLMRARSVVGVACGSAVVQVFEVPRETAAGIERRETTRYPVISFGEFSDSLVVFKAAVRPRERPPSVHLRSASNHAI